MSVDHVVPLARMPELLHRLVAQLADRFAGRGADHLRDRFDSRSENLLAQAAVIRQVLIDAAQPEDG